MHARHHIRTALAATVAIIATGAMAQDAPPPIDYDAPVYTAPGTRPAITLPTFEPAPAVASAPVAAASAPAIAGPARFEGGWQGRWVSPDRYEGQWIGSVEPVAGATYAAGNYAQDDADVPDFVARCARYEQGGSAYVPARATDADLPDRCREYRTGGTQMAYAQPGYPAVYGQPAYGYPPYGYTMVPSYEPVYVERRVIETVETVPIP